MSDTTIFILLSQLLYSNDPIGINFGDNVDEYDNEAGTILPRLNKELQLEEVMSIVHEEFVYWFSSCCAGDKEKYRSISEQIVTTVLPCLK